MNQPFAPRAAPLTLFEYGETEYAWTDHDLTTLDRLNRSAGAEILRAAVRRSRKVLQAHQYVGVVRLGAQAVQILPKIYQPDVLDDVLRARDATRNLLVMLSYARQVPVREPDEAHLLRRNADWFEILTHLFAAHLAGEWQRGAHRAYQDADDELPVLKGKWRIADQLRRPGQQHRLAVSYSEFKADNALNRVFRYVVERLWHLTRDDANRRQLGLLRAWMEEVTLLPALSAADASPALITRLNARYEPLLNLARVFLANATLQLAPGDVRAFALVFDMNLLFQEFVVHFIARHRAAVLPPALQDCELLPQTRGAVQHLAQSEGRAVFPLYPDLAFRAPGTLHGEGDHFALLLDTKYKRLDPAATGRRASHAGIPPDDFYQMFTYAERYACPRALLLYPQSEGDPPVRQSFELPHTGRAIDAATLNLQLDLRTEGERLAAELRAILSAETAEPRGASA